MDIEIFEINGGFGYRVGGVYQEFNPYEADNVPMTEEQARQFAEEVALRIE